MRWLWRWWRAFRTSPTDSSGLPAMDDAGWAEYRAAKAARR